MAEPSLRSRVTAETLGTGLLVATVVGSGVMATRLSDDVGIQLLANCLATGAVLVALILTLQPVSAHFNPVVTLVDRIEGRLDTPRALALVGGQVAGGLVGAVLANLMFDLPAVAWATTERTGAGQWLGEVVATTGLAVVVFLMLRTGRGEATAYAVAGWIVAAYWFTSSTSFANPAVTVGRMVSDTFAGIRPLDVPAFVLAQLVGAGLALVLLRLLHPRETP